MAKKSLVLILLIISVIALLLIGISLFVNKSKTVEAESVKIKVVGQEWTGWVKEQPAPFEKNYTLSVGEIMDISDSVYGNFKFIINKIEQGKVEIESIGELISSISNQGVNLRDDFKKISVGKGDSFELGTPTMDAGVTLRFYILDIIRQ